MPVYGRLILLRPAIRRDYGGQGYRGASSVTGMGGTGQTDYAECRLAGGAFCIKAERPILGLSMRRTGSGRLK